MRRTRYCATLVLAAAALACHAQAPNPTSAMNPFFGSITAHPATSETLHLSLDDAIRRGLENNLGLKEAEEAENAVKGEKNEALQEFLPTVTLSGGTGVFQHNLAAMGFSPSLASQFPSGSFSSGFSLITRDDLTRGQVNYRQSLFSGPVIAGYRAARAAEKVVYYAKESARGDVIEQVASAYLMSVAAGSQVDNASAQEAADRLLFEQARAAHEAGTASNLDELRARVQWQAQQQALIASRNALEKDLILLKRETGIDPGQKIQLTDPTPYSDLATRTPGEVRAEAYKNRQDYQNLIHQVIEYRAVRSAYRSQRLPRLSFSGFYGVDTVNGAGTHGNFAAVGTLSMPLFHEAELRGNEDAAAAQLTAVTAQLADLREHIDEQVRDALLDVEAAHKLVEVARSNVDLATQALSDENDRVKAGVDDNLPLVTAQATLAAAKSNLVESLYRYNMAKLGLARAAGVLESQFRAYLGR